MWEVRVHVSRDPATGKVRQLSRTTRKGIVDARQLRTRLIAEVDEERHRGTTSTFASLLLEWVSHGERIGRSPDTLAGYRRKIDTAIRPGLGSVRLDKLTGDYLDVWYDSLLASGTTPATVMQYHRIIAAALHQGERWGWVRHNVARLARPPTVPRRELTVPPPERVRSLIELAASSRAPEMSSIIAVAALTGLRRGELCGLRWSDVDWSESALTVRRSIWQTPEGWGVKEPKTHQIRRLVLGDDTVGVLGDRLRRVRELSFVAEIPLVSAPYVFSPDADGGRPTMPNVVTQAFRRLCNQMQDRALRADPPRMESWAYRLHDLRRYTATELFRPGDPTVADQLGQTDASLTRRVSTHDTQDEARAAAVSLEEG